MAALVLLVGLTVAVGTEEALASRGSSEDAQSGQLYAMSPSTFGELERVHAEIDPESPDLVLLEAAIFHETNRVRAEHGLQPLEFLEPVREAARMQSRLMAEDGEVRHENPQHEALRTLEDRIAQAGLDASLAAENVATEFLLQYESGEPVYPRREEGRTVFSYAPGGEPIPPHTPASLAEELVRRWMESPEHRRNVLHERPSHLGTAAILAEDEQDMGMLYCTQVFFAPL